jgi:hypothetical protein
MTSCCKAICLLFLGLSCLPLFGETWYIRPDGGSRHTAGQPGGQCDGKADAPYSGHGVNQHCAFKDYRYLYDDTSWNNSAWAISGGDTVIIRGGPWRVGFNQGVSAKDVWCAGSGNPYNCGNPAIPAGTPEHHTRILGENYASCGAGKKTQLFGGYGLGAVLGLGNTHYVDIECIELTRHSQCIKFGVPAIPGGCRTDYPLDDYSDNGIGTNNQTHDILLQDVWIHGFTSRGIIGSIGGTVTATRVDISTNGAAGWDFDDGRGTPSINGAINLSYVTIEWNGCNQAWPSGTVLNCYSQSTGGYGDGIGSPGGTCLTSHVDHSTFRYNTQDGFDMLHNDAGNCSLSITDSASYGNLGAQFKWGSNDNPAVFTNNLVLANCTRLSAPFPGLPGNYNANLPDVCRAQDAIALNLHNGGTLLMANNTIVSYSPTTFDIDCGDVPNCPTATFIFKNNIVIGYDNPGTYNLGGKAGGPGGFYFGHPFKNFVHTNNIYYGFRNIEPRFLDRTEKIADPKLVSQSHFTKESDLDNFDFHLSATSPAIKAGARIPEVQTDYSGKPRPSTGPYDIGAYQF